MILKEEFTEERCQKLFSDMIDEFSDCFDLDLYFDASLINPKLEWLNKNNRKALGVCSSRGVREYGEFVMTSCTIKLNPNLLKFDEDGEAIIKNTLAHELCHACKGCQNHGYQFHKVGDIIRKNLGYVIDTKADVDASAYFNKYLPQTKYRVECDVCGGGSYMPRLSDVIKNPRNYSCGKCGGSLSSYILNDATGEYELYRTSQDEPDYKYQIKCSDDNCGWSVGFKRRDKTYKNFLKSLLNGATPVCPKCKYGALYAIDDGRAITNATVFENPLARKHVERIVSG